PPRPTPFPYPTLFRSKLDQARHGADLWEAVKGHDRIWTYMSYGPFADPESFAHWLRERAALADPFSLAVVDRSGRSIGITTLVRSEEHTSELQSPYDL